MKSPEPFPEYHNIEFFLSLVEVAGAMPTKCKKCTVDCVVLVDPSYAAIARTANHKLRPKLKDERRVVLALVAYRMLRMVAVAS